MGAVQDTRAGQADRLAEIARSFDGPGPAIPATVLLARVITQAIRDADDTTVDGEIAAARDLEDAAQTCVTAGQLDLAERLCRRAEALRVHAWAVSTWDHTDDTDDVNQFATLLNDALDTALGAAIYQRYREAPHGTH